MLRFRSFFPSRKSALLIVFSIALIGGASWWTRGPREPEYQGQRLSEWLKDKRFPDDRGGSHYVPDQQEELASAFQTMRPDAVKWLAWSLEHGQNPAPIGPLEDSHSGYVKMLYRLRQKILGRNFDEYYDERIVALKSLRVIGPDAVSAIPALLPVLADPNSRHSIEAALVLVRMGFRAKDAIAQGFPQGADYVRNWILIELDNLIPRDRESWREGELAWTADFLTKVCRDPDRDIRSHGAHILCNLFAMHALYGLPEDRQTLRPFLPVLIDLLASSDSDVCEYAAQSLKYFGPEAAPAIPKLIDLLDHPSKDRCKMVGDALSVIDRVEKLSISRLRELAESADKPVAYAAADVIKSFEEPPEEVQVPDGS